MWKNISLKYDTRAIKMHDKDYRFYFMVLDNGILCVWIAFSIYSFAPFVYKKAAFGARVASLAEARHLDIIIVDVSTNSHNSIALTNTYVKVEAGEWIRESLFDIVAKSILKLARKKFFQKGA
ncbi:MAG TPA: hypothetical protein PKW30_05575 [Campylobacterales bacterium]|nr:hypothetical protein [Campylobacterales bacterium]